MVNQPAINVSRALLRNPLFEFIVFPVVPFNRISLFSKGLIAFISFISLFVSLSPELVIGQSFPLSFLPKKLCSVFKKNLGLSFSD